MKESLRKVKEGKNLAVIFSIPNSNWENVLTVFPIRNIAYGEK